MSKKKFKFNHLLFKVLIEKDLNNFRIVEWRDAYLTECNVEDAKNPKKTYKKIYRQVLRMTKNGLLKKYLIQARGLTHILKQNFFALPSLRPVTERNFK